MKPVSDVIYEYRDLKQKELKPAVQRNRLTAASLGLREYFFRDAIFQSPELVVGPCREAGLIEDDEWRSLATEFRTDAGKIDVLLVSSQGRLAVVETKLVGNPENRRKVLAQVVDYLASLPDYAEAITKLIPPGDADELFSDPDEVIRSAIDGNVLLIIASDEVDERVERLSRSLFADNLDRQWELALVDLAVYRSDLDPTGTIHVVPTLRGAIKTEVRHTIRFDESKPGARLKIERYVSGDSRPERQKWNEELYFESFATFGAPVEVRNLAQQLKALQARYPDALALEYGTGKKGTMVLKRLGGGLIEVRASGKLRFRPEQFTRALGEQDAHIYRQGLSAMFPGSFDSEIVLAVVPEAQSAKAAAAVYSLVQDVIEKAEQRRSS